MENLNWIDALIFGLGALVGVYLKKLGAWLKSKVIDVGPPTP